jgi:hypothetical protein
MSQQTAAIRVDLTAAQKQSLNFLQTNFGLSDDDLNRCIFFRKDDNQPWIPPEILEAIARKTGKFQSINAVFDQYVEPLEQIIFTASVTDEHGRVYMRSGVATMREKPSGVEIDTPTLARGRALSAALTAAGYNPFKAGSVVEIGRPNFPSHSGGRLSDRELKLHEIEDEAALRRKDLKQIHAIAEGTGLIVGDEMKAYRNWLFHNFGVRSAATLDAEARAQVINKLHEHESDVMFIQQLPSELQADAFIA